jgi:hypothetical protein
MNEPSEKQTQATRSENEETSTFKSIFFGDNPMPIRVPDYQRAYSWEQKQIELFLADLVKYQDLGKGYYFGHFIAQDIGSHWEIVDGQQRITTFVLFLMVCRVLLPTDAHALAYSMIQQFSTVSYDREALKTIGRNLGAFLEANKHFDERKPPPDKEIIERLSLKGPFTRSQRRMVLALLLFHKAFQRGDLEGEKMGNHTSLKRDKIGEYIAVVMKAQCSHHPTKDKSVAVNIFEMQNTRGIPLTTLEIIKAMLMKFVYDNGGNNRESKVEQIQAEFGEIYSMEERVADSSFRGEMTMEHLLRLHLRVVDDGTKKTADQFHSPATNANRDALVEYVDSRLHYIDGDKSKSKIKEEDGVQYALKMAKEFKQSVRIVSENLPEWNKEVSLVGDVLILDQDLSCQFFLIICRCLESGPNKADGHIGKASLLLWEKLLFTRDFHEKYYYLSYRDNFPALFASCGADANQITDVIKRYLADGFRSDGPTKGLQSIVYEYLDKHRERILTGAFHWHPWKSKIIYAIYKFEKSKGADIRNVMKDTISVEHILPQEWDWIRGTDEDLKAMSEDDWASFHKGIDDCINGIGNLLLITPGENTSVRNNHPAEKEYDCVGGSYAEHDRNREKWRSSKEWSNLIRARGEEIFNFMLGKLVDASEKPLRS